MYICDVFRFSLKEKQQKHQKTSVKPRRRFKEVIFLGPEKRSLGGLES